MPRLRFPDKEYSKLGQQEFRRDIELRFYSLADKINSSKRHSGIISALSFKRNLLSLPRLGINKVANDTKEELPVSGPVKIRDSLIFGAPSVVKVDNGEAASLVFEDEDGSPDYITIDSSSAANDAVIINSVLNVLGSNDVIKDIQFRYRGHEHQQFALFDQSSTDDPQVIEVVEFEYNFALRSGVSTVLVLFFWALMSTRFEQGPIKTFECIHTDSSGTTIMGTDDSDKGASTDVTSGSGRVRDLLDPMYVFLASEDAVFLQDGVPMFSFAVKNDMPIEDNQTIKFRSSCSRQLVDPPESTMYTLGYSAFSAVSFDLGVT